MKWYEERPKHSQTIPMKCSFCGKQTYFYRDENGGRVLFSELGDPWPIHDCRSANHFAISRSHDISGRRVTRRAFRAL
jgi:hypothetical protein